MTQIEEFHLLDENAAVLNSLGSYPLAILSEQAKRIINGQTNKNQTLYLVVRRHTSGEPFPVKVAWGTDLMILGGQAIRGEPIQLTCDDETDGFLGSEMGEDEISMGISRDGALETWGLYRNFDCNDTQVTVSPWEGPGALAVFDRTGGHDQIPQECDDPPEGGGRHLGG